ncbi:MAG: 4'-phosphopantetheinyl transferase superfamily protein [Balneolaceae bacterium]
MNVDDSRIIKVGEFCLPEDLFVGVKKLENLPDTPGKGSDARKKERKAGRQLIRQLVREEIGDMEFEIFGSPNQKPQGIYGEHPLHISISHVSGLIGGAISENRIVGLDLENKNRTVHPGLQSRILHPKEGLLEDQHSVLQIWTLKEAALKWCGTGLRTAMSKIYITGISRHKYHAVFEDGKETEICNFDYNDHWVSVAYSL